MTERHARTAIVVAAVVLTATIVGVGIATPGYRPTTDAVSRLGARDEPWRVPWRAGFAMFGLLVAIGAPAIASRHPVRRRAVRWLVVGYGACTAIVGLAPKDPPRAPHTLVSRVHVDVAVVAGALLLGAIACVAFDAPDARDRRTSARVGVAAVVAVAVFPFLWGTAFYGITELFLIASAVAWLCALAFAQAPKPTARIALAVTSARRVSSRRSSAVASCVHDQ